MEQKIIWHGVEVKTPQNLKLKIKYSALAQEVQKEWDMVEKTPNLKSMTLTAFAVSVIDIISSKRQQITKDISNYINCDVIYYFADRDSELIAHQHKVWDEWIKWAENKLQCQAKTTNGITALAQSDEFTAAATKLLSEADDWHFYAFQNFISICASFTLGYALYCGCLSAERAIELSHADSLYQEEQWGRDTQATQERQNMIDDLTAIQIYLHLLHN